MSVHSSIDLLLDNIGCGCSLEALEGSSSNEYNIHFSGGIKEKVFDLRL